MAWHGNSNSPQSEKKGRPAKKIGFQKVKKLTENARYVSIKQNRLEGIWNILLILRTGKRLMYRVFCCRNVMKKGNTDGGSNGRKKRRNDAGSEAAGVL